MKKIALILAAVISAAAFFATAPAQAGGKRLHFGYPLGSFQASNHSGGSSSYGSRRHYASKTAAQRRAAARRAAARKAAARKIAAQRRAAAKTKRLAQIRKEKAQKVQQTAKVEKETEDREWHAPVRASAIAGTNTLNFRDEAETPAETETELNDENTEVETAETNTNVEVAELACKRFIPSAGMTVTVPCGQ